MSRAASDGRSRGLQLHGRYPVVGNDNRDMSKLHC